MKFKRFISALLAVVFVATASIIPVNTAFAREFPSSEFDTSINPKSVVRVDEFIALISHISYWSEPTDAPYTADKTGAQPISWAAGYVQTEINKGIVNPEEITYSEPATIAYAARYLSNAKGLYAWDFEKKYNTKGTEGLSAEDKMYLDVAFDHGLIQYFDGINAKTQLKREDINYLLVDKMADKVYDKMLVSDNSMKNLHVFFENNDNKMTSQLNLLKTYSNSITQLSLFGVKESYDKNGTPNITFDKAGQKEAIKYCRENGIQSFMVVDNYNFKGESSSDPYDVYDQQGVYDMISKNPLQAAKKLTENAKKYSFDGVHITFDLFGGEAYRSKFSAFINTLANELHKEDMLLMVSVGAFFKDVEEEKSIFDYTSIGSSADYIHMILYDENSANAYNSGIITEPGCTSSLTYIERVLKYASYKMPEDKIILGTQSFATEFSANSARNVEFNPAWLSSPLFEYSRSEGSGHITQGGVTTYFETPEGMKERMLEVYDLKLGGMSSFSLTSEFPYIFTMLNGACSYRGEIIKAMRLKLVPSKYYNNYNQGIKRDELCDFLVAFIEAKSGKSIDEYLKEKGITSLNSSFTDTNSKNVAVINALGIMKGRSATTFGTEELNRQEAAAIVKNIGTMLDIKPGEVTSFKDTAALADWAKTSIAYASSITDKTNSIKVMTGAGEGKFNPSGKLTRYQAMIILKRLYNAA